MKDENMKLMNEYFVNWKNRICFSFLVSCTRLYTPLFCPTVGWLVGWLVGQSVSWSVGQSVRPSFGQPPQRADVLKDTGIFRRSSIFRPSVTSVHIFLSNYSKRWKCKKHTSSVPTVMKFLSLRAEGLSKVQSKFHFTGSTGSIISMCFIIAMLWQ